jgi:hypothetical protein
MAEIRENRPGTEPVQGRRSARLLLALAAGLPGVASAAANEASGFAPVYELLESHCGACHVQGEADGPWSLNTPPSADRFAQCLTEPEAAALRCATYHELVDPPGPGIPAWIRPEDPPSSEPYAQACDTEISFHIGHSLPQRLPDADCERFLRWIEAGAAR